MTSEMNVVVVSLASRPDRLERALRRCAQAGLDPDVFAAMGPHDLPTDPAPGLSGGAIGCALSHREVLASDRWSIHTPLLVLEDDVVFEERFAQQLDKLLGEAPPDWCLIQVGWLPTEGDRKRATRWRERFAENSSVRRLSQMRRPEIDIAPSPIVARPLGWGTHCYLIREPVRSQLARLLHGPLMAPVDHYLRFLFEGHYPGVYRTRHSLAGQDADLGSDIVGRAPNPSP